MEKLRFDDDKLGRGIAPSGADVAAVPKAPPAPSTTTPPGSALWPVVVQAAVAGLVQRKSWQQIVADIEAAVISWLTKR